MEFIRNDQNVGSDFDLRDGVALSNRAIDINPDDIEDILFLKEVQQQHFMDQEVLTVVLLTTKRGQWLKMARIYEHLF